MIAGLTDKGCFQQNKKRKRRKKKTATLSLNNACVLIPFGLRRSVISDGIRHRRVIAVPLWRTSPLGILGYYHPVSLVSFYPSQSGWLTLK